MSYTPKILNSSNPNIANSQWVGYTGELNLANTVAKLPNQQVLRYGDAIGTRGADVISVDTTNGDIYLWDNKYRSSDVSIPSSPTFTQGSARLNNALRQAVEAVENHLICTT